MKTHRIKKKQVQKVKKTTVTPPKPIHVIIIHQESLLLPTSSLLKDLKEKNRTHCFSTGSTR
jgi:hypothetical protein